MGFTNPSNTLNKTSLVPAATIMIGDGLSHVSFGALAIALACGWAPLQFSIPLVIVAAFFLLRIAENSRINADAAIAVTSASALAIGILVTSRTTGMDVCAKLRGILHTKKIGHAGTLDPMATGVLPVFVGQATRAVSFAESGRKEYIAGLRLGLVTNTQDTSGETLSQTEVSVTQEALTALLPRFTGTIYQIPPMATALISVWQMPS